MTKTLRTEDEIRAAGRAAVADWRLTEQQVDFVVSLITPVFTDVWHLLDANAAQQATAQRSAA